jgi:hypothetical protein
MIFYHTSLNATYSIVFTDNAIIVHSYSEDPAVRLDMITAIEAMAIATGNGFMSIDIDDQAKQGVVDMLSFIQKFPTTSPHTEQDIIEFIKRVS